MSARGADLCLRRAYRPRANSMEHADGPQNLIRGLMRAEGAIAQT